MYWQEDDDKEQPFVVPDNIVDLSFGIDCRSLPVDHAHALAQVIDQALEWFAEEEAAALHLIHGAESGNGWERPEEGDDLIYLSRRTKLVLRLPKHRVDDAKMLVGQTLDIEGSALTVKEAKVRLLSTHPAQYARHVACDAEQDEDSFIAESVAQLRELGLRFKKVLCGRSHTFQFPEGAVTTRSLFVADLPPEDAVTLQQHGIGSGRKQGLGVFIPHKTVTK